jgi:GTP-binding protein
MVPFTAEFVTSAFALDGCPRWKRAEVALAGRSNVGKSSLLNALAGAKGLARTSKTPGRTRCLNFFAVGDTLALCDLPGFGYAKMSHEDAAKIASMMHEYIHGRANLAAIAILIDCRRGPQQDELDLAAMATERGIEVIPVATKCDKLRRSERAAALKRFDSMRVPPIFCSVTSGEGIDDLRRRILAVDGKKAAKTTPPSASNSATFEEWLKWVFDHPVADDEHKEWWWAEPAADEGGRWLDRPPIPALNFVTKLFESPLRHLSPYSDAQIDQGLWFIVHTANSKHFEWLIDGRIDVGLRKRCIRSIENLSRALFAPRCSDEVVHGTKPLDSICYMLWDLAIHHADRIQDNLDGTYSKIRDPEIDMESVNTLARIIAIPSIACQQSALHGLGHLVHDACLGANTIVEYLGDHPNLRSDIRKYAQQALLGKIL